MGVSQSKKSYAVPANFYGGIFTHIEKDAFFPGETLSGHIYLNIQNSYPGNKLFLSLKGYELTEWDDYKTGNSNFDENRPLAGHEKVRISQKETIKKQEKEVYSWNDKCAPPGQYAIPFQFRIPSSLPGSFYFSRKKDNLVAEIKYTLTAYLKSDKDDIAKVKHKTTIVIREAPHASVEAQEGHYNRNMVCCCIDQGPFKMKIQSDKNAYAPSEVVTLVADIDNSQCKAEFEDVEALFIQVITLRSGGFFKNIEIPIHKEKLGKIAPREQFVGDNARKISIKLPPGYQKDKVISNTENKDYKNVSSCTYGSLISSRFFANVTCDTRNSCIKLKPSAQIHIEIYAPATEKTPTPIPPENWAPRQIAPVNIAFENDYQRNNSPNKMISNQEQNISNNKSYQNGMVNQL